MLLAVHYRVMEHAGSLESTQEARVALRFLCALQTSRVLHLTNRFHFAVHLFSSRSQMTSKCGKNKKLAHEAIAECVTDVLTTFWRPLWSIYWTDERQHGIYLFYTIKEHTFLCIRASLFKKNPCAELEGGSFPHLKKHENSDLASSIVYTKWSNFIGCYALAKNCDCLRKITQLQTWIECHLPWNGK